MARVVLEDTIVKSIILWLKTQPGCLVRKRHGDAFGVAGDADLYGSIRGRHFELEVKRPGNKPTPLQVRRLAEWAAAGAIVGVVHSVEEAKQVLSVAWSGIAAMKVPQQQLEVPMRGPAEQMGP
jgi:hypothetical protein